MTKLDILENENKEIRMTSLDLVDVINEFRELEDDKAELKHGDFMKKVKEELNILKMLEISQGNISDSTYINSRGKTYPCYELNRDGCLQMLNSESALVRYKTIEYINKIEMENIKLQSDNLELESNNKELHLIATSDDDLALREYQADAIKYSWKRIRPLLEQCTYRNIEEVVESILEFHNKRLKKRDRCNYDNHKVANRTEYKQIVREHIYNILDGIYNVSKDDLLTTVISNVKEDLIIQKLETNNRSVGKLIANKDKNIIDLQCEIDKSIVIPKDSEYCVVNYHGFSHNSMYDYNGYRVCKSKTYNNWIDKFPMEQVVDMKSWVDVDFSKPIEILIDYTCKSAFDVRNLDMT